MRAKSRRCCSEEASSTMQRYVFAALWLFGCIAPALAQTPNLSEAKPAAEAKLAAAGVKMQDPAPGDHWTYEVKDEISGTVKLTRTDMVTDVTKNEINVRAQIVGGNSGNVIYDHSWDIVQNGAFKYAPNDGTGVRLPLAVGAQWKFSVDVVNGRYGNTFKRVGTSRVVRQEGITTKAGTFDTFVIETNYTGRLVQDRSVVNQNSWLTWFDPDIDHWVKRTTLLRQRGHLVSNNTLELTEYGRKKE
jgi:hypothetical protein